MPIPADGATIKGEVAMSMNQPCHEIPEITDEEVMRRAVLFEVIEEIQQRTIDGAVPEPVVNAFLTLLSFAGRSAEHHTMPQTKQDMATTLDWLREVLDSRRIVVE